MSFMTPGEDILFAKSMEEYETFAKQLDAITGIVFAVAATMLIIIVLSALREFGFL